MITIKNKTLLEYLLLISIIGVFSACFHAMNVLHNLPLHIAYNDIWAFYGKAKEEGMPYIDKKIEYPVITGLFIQFMGVLGQDYGGYYFYSSLFLILFAITATYFMLKTIERENQKRLVIFWILAPSMFFFLIYNWDIIAVLFVVIAFYALKQDMDNLASLFLALGFSSKFFPVIYLLPLLLKKNRIHEWAQIIGVFVMTTLVINIFFMLSNFDGWYYFFIFNRVRPPNPDSIWEAVKSLFNFGFSIARINMISFLAFLISSTVLVWTFRHESTLKLCFILTLTMLIVNKILSPQYFLWLLPFYVLLPLVEKKTFYTLELSNLIAFFGIMFYYGTGVITFHYLFNFFVIVRHIILIFLLMKTLDANSILRKLAQKLRDIKK